MRLIRTVATCLLIATFAIAAGCWRQVTMVYTVNPDGSGKVAFDICQIPDLVAPRIDSQPATHNATTKDATSELLADMLGDATGVDAWACLLCERDEHDWNHVKGVAYFPDIAKLTMTGHCQTRVGRPNAREMVLEMKLDFVNEENLLNDTTQPAEMTKDELKKAMKEARESYAEQLESKDTQAILAMIKNDITFQLPGTLGEVHGFTKDKNSVRMLFDGQKYMKGLGACLADDKMLAKMIRTGKYDADFLTQQWFGTKGFLLTATTKGDLKPLFDYKAEMSKAKAAMPAMLKKLAKDAATSQPASAPSSQTERR